MCYNTSMNVPPQGPPAPKYTWKFSKYQISVTYKQSDDMCSDFRDKLVQEMENAPLNKQIKITCLKNKHKPWFNFPKMPPLLSNLQTQTLDQLYWISYGMKQNASGN